MSQLITAVSEKDHYLGAWPPVLTLVEYGDYQCPVCGRFAPLVKQLHQHLRGKLTFVFRHFPLQKAHPFALQMACVAEAADFFQRFWQMHEMLFRNASLYSSEKISQYASLLGLEGEDILKIAEARDTKLRVEEQFKDGIASGVNGIPCFFVQGHRYEGDISFEHILRALMQCHL